MFQAYTADDQPTKRCGHCDRVLPLSAFSRRTKSADGHQGRCRECAKKGWKEYSIHGTYRPIRPIRTLPEGHKWCGGCNKSYPSDEFYRNGKERDGRNHRCRTCERAYSESHRRWHKIKYLYGLTKDEYLLISRAQGDVCAICGRTDTGRALVVDHDHETGKVRGLLCLKCNRAIGLIGDDADMLNRASQYVRGLLRKPGVPKQVDAVDSTRKA